MLIGCSSYVFLKHITLPKLYVWDAPWVLCLTVCLKWSLLSHSDWVMYFMFEMPPEYCVLLYVWNAPSLVIQAEWHIICLRCRPPPRLSTMTYCMFEVVPPESFRLIDVFYVWDAPWVLWLTVCLRWSLLSNSGWVMYCIFEMPLGYCVLLYFLNGPSWVIQTEWCIVCLRCPLSTVSNCMFEVVPPESFRLSDALYVWDAPWIQFEMLHSE